MKIKNLLLILVLLVSYGSAEAQLLKKLKKKAEKAVERKLEHKVEKETEKTMDSVLNPEKNQNKDDKSKNEEVKTKTENGKVLVRGKSDQSANENDSNNEMANQEEASPPNLKPWSKYNFVPGDKIIFQDDLIDEENGEFPSRWDLTKGNAENATFENENVINFDNKSIIMPLMETDEYLPEVFTIEFDAYYDQEKMGSYVYHQLYKIRFWNGDSYVVLPNKLGTYNPIKIYRYGASLSGKIKGIKKDYKAFEESLKEKQPVWRHIAIAFNKLSLKVFVDQFRALNIPNLNFKPKMVSIEAYTNTHIKEPYTRLIKNIRISEGGKKLYDRVMADGKFITRGILFDVNKTTIKPESMGVINQVAKMMQQHPDLNFSIEGHTDSDGADDYNLQLSKNRARAVKSTLINLGVDASRMQTKGLGESVPVSDNTSSEGKANNRRVEFIKI